MARYENTKLKTDKKNKKKYYTTTIYDKVPERNDDMYFVSQWGDRLDILAQRFYGNPNLWWYIAKANNLTFMSIPHGTSLRIPATTEYAIGL